MHDEQGESSPDRQGWVVFLDVFGFTAMLDSQEIEDTHRRLTTCHKRMSNLPTWSTDPPLTYLLSDSVFLLYLVPTPETKFQVMRRCIQDVEEVLGVFAQDDLPLRGGIAYGKVRTGPLTLVGQAVARAASYEASFPLPLVLLPAREILGESCTTDWVPEMTDVGLKNGQLMLAHTVFPKPLEALTDLATRRYEESRIWGPYDVANAWHQVLEEIRSLVEKRRSRNA